MKTVTAKYVTDVTFIDPDTQNEIECEVFKDPVSGAMFAIDASFTEQVTETIPSPFNPDVRLRLFVPDSIPIQ